MLILRPSIILYFVRIHFNVFVPTSGASDGGVGVLRGARGSAASGRSLPPAEGVGAAEPASGGPARRREPVRARLGAGDAAGRYTVGSSIHPS